MQLPAFFIVGSRPVKAVAVQGKGMDILALDWDTAEFTRHMEYLTRIALPDGEVDEVTLEEFDRRVAEIRESVTRSSARRPKP
jgi:hypothetical protein